METFTDDTVVALATFLSPHDMLSLSLTCKRFGAKHGTTTSRSRERESREGRKVRQKTDTISLLEVAAHTVLLSLATEDERNALPRRGNESWIGLYQEFLKLFRLPLQFDKLVGRCVEYVERSERAKVLANNKKGLSMMTCTAICSNIMRAGKHYVSFQVYDSPSRALPGIMCGVMRPTTKDITSLERCHPAEDLSSFSLKDYEMLHSDNVDVCLLNTYYGNGIIRNRWETPDEECQSFDWDGMEPTHEKSYKIGLALDLDEGTLDVYKNDRRIGTMKTGLFGEYCWVASMLSFNEKVSVTIGR